MDMPRIASPPIGGNTLVRFPDRRATAIRIIRDDAAWLVVAREHGWLYGSRESAVADARWLSNNLGLRILEAAA
jgi:hypothetical protein